MVRSISRYHLRNSHENESYVQPIAIPISKLYKEKAFVIGDTTSRSHCVDVFIVHKTLIGVDLWEISKL